MIKIDNFYFVVEDINKSINFYTKLFDKKPTNTDLKHFFISKNFVSIKNA